MHTPKSDASPTLRYEAVRGAISKLFRNALGTSISLDGLVVLKKESVHTLSDESDCYKRKPTSQKQNVCHLNHGTTTRFLIPNGANGKPTVSWLREDPPKGPDLQPTLSHGYSGCAGGAVVVEGFTSLPPS